MTAALILLTILIVGGLILYIHDRLRFGRQDRIDALEDEEKETPGDMPGQHDNDESDSGECCGLHITCEKDSLLVGLDRETLYYDDEELDAFKGRQPDSYTDQETEMFREVLLTLRPDDIAGWARSISARGITLPNEVREELLMIVTEAREKHPI